MKTLNLNSVKYTGLVILFFVVTLNATSQSTIVRSPIPMSGHYPGGHVGVRGGDTPEPGIGAFVFNRLYEPGNVIDDQGNSLGATNRTANAIIAGAAWNTKYKILGMTWGGLVGIPINDIYNRPSGQNYTSTSYGLGDIVIIPFGLYGKSKYFDYQFAVGVWTGSGYFSPGSIDNHGSGYTEMLYSVGGIYYLKGDRRSFNFSAVARIEQMFKQRVTDVKPGDDVVVDWGIGSPYLPLDKEHQHIVDIGISGFVTTQFTKETGTYAALNNSLYRCFAAGPEVNYAYRPLKLKFLFRMQQEFGARNTTQGTTYWISVAHKFGHI